MKLFKRLILINWKKKKINPLLGTQTLFGVSVVLPTPAHGRLPEVLSYCHSAVLPLGTLVRVPLGARELLGVVWTTEEGARGGAGELGLAALKPITAVLDVPPLGKAWVDLIRFAAGYYQRFAGELAMAALPPQLRDLDEAQFARLMKKRGKKSKIISSQAMSDKASQPPHLASLAQYGLQVSPEQEQVLAHLQSDDPRPKLLFGATGSGKTEVYLRRIEQVLAADDIAQALVMVPEINLTPQMEARFQGRIEARFGAGTVVLMHSGMTPAQRTASWLAAHLGQARLVLGTRLAVLASMPHLRLIVVDEEHDPSYKSQDGSRYSARDLAVFRGSSGASSSPSNEPIQVILGSATPSIETWHNANPVGDKPSRYQRLDMPSRIHAAAMPKVRLVDMRLQQKSELIAGGLAPSLMAAITERAERGEQSLLFLNRRGYAPVLHCGSCEWKSACPNCSANQVFHKKDRRLRCHHCSLTTAVPRQCPLCGNLDIGMPGRGTEQLEELLVAQLGEKFRVLRLDADSTKTKGSLEVQMASVHAGEVDVLVGTQMVTKGHDFRRITLVAAVNPDSALFAADFRAPERLFSLLMQAAGRAGRDASMSGQAEMWLQTHHPQHPLYKALAAHDYPAFAATQLAEREGASMPPFSYQALVRAEGRTQELAQAFLDSAAALVGTEPEFDLFRDPASKSYVTLYPAVPMPMQRIANVERAQMLVEAPSRMALQRMLAAWQPYLRELKTTGKTTNILRWALDVDPLTI